MKHSKVNVTPEVAAAVEELYKMTNGFQYEMYCLMNKYLFNKTWDYVNPLLEPLRSSDLFSVVDAIRYGYEVKIK